MTKLNLFSIFLFGAFVRYGISVSIYSVLTTHNVISFRKILREFCNLIYDCCSLLIFEVF